MNWFLWRIVLAPEIPDGLRDVRCYSLRDLVEAHAALDAVEAIREYQRQRAETDKHLRR